MLVSDKALMFPDLLVPFIFSNDVINNNNNNNNNNNSNNNNHKS